MRTLELLAPAKNLAMAQLAINHGADAIYIGCSDFGARQNAANSIPDVAVAVNYAHQYHAKVYVTLNTILMDNELEKARQLAYQLYNIGVDALIIQDLGLLNMDLPPIALHSSTQMDNRTLEKIKYYKRWGISRVILARELSLEQIAHIHQHCDIDLECFVHGSLCVCYSGQCYLSHRIGERSANRGVCAQPCRLPYLLKSDNNIVAPARHYLSLKDMNRLDFLSDLANAGVKSFKIEGRLKDEAYLINVVSAYRQKLDAFLNENTSLYAKSSLGHCSWGFIPDISKTFNRDFTNYFINNQREKIANLFTPKSIGKYIGKIDFCNSSSFHIQTEETIVNGDGLCWINNNNNLSGCNVNTINNNNIQCSPNSEIPSKGTAIYRNYDHAFHTLLKREKTIRKINVNLYFYEKNNELVLSLVDEQGNESHLQINLPKDLANNKDLALKTIKQQLQKSGNSIFEIKSLEIALNKIYFIPTSVINNLRRQLFENHQQKLLSLHYKPKALQRENTTNYYIKNADFRQNISNSLAQKFYEKMGVHVKEKALECNVSCKEKEIFRSKYCLRYELEACLKSEHKNNLPNNLVLNYNNFSFKVGFDCEKCEMFLIST